MIDPQSVALGAELILLLIAVLIVGFAYLLRRAPDLVLEREEIEEPEQVVTTHESVQPSRRAS